MRKTLIIALGLITIGALVGAQPADAKRKGPPVGIGPKPLVLTGFTWSTPESPVDPRPHPQPTDPLPNGGTTKGGVIISGTANAGTTKGGVITGRTTNGVIINGGTGVTNSIAKRLN